MQHFSCDLEEFYGKTILAIVEAENTTHDFIDESVFYEALDKCFELRQHIYNGQKIEFEFIRVKNTTMYLSDTLYSPKIVKTVIDREVKDMCREIHERYQFKYSWRVNTIVTSIIK